MQQDRISKHLTSSQQQNKTHVVYWMQQSLRVEYNHALSYAISTANEKDLPLCVVYFIDFDFPESNYRFFKFMLEGVKEVVEKLVKLGIKVDVKLGKPENDIYSIIASASDLIMDHSYLKYQNSQRKKIIETCKEKALDISITSIESELLIPIASVYPKKAYSARIIRPWVLKNMMKYRDHKKMESLKKQSINAYQSAFDFDDMDNEIRKHPIDFSVKPHERFKGGYTEAVTKLDNFLMHKFKFYADHSDPSKKIQSYLSPYIHFGQISVLDILDRLDASGTLNYGAYDALIEQLLVRRTLAFNFVSFEPNYDVYEHMTENWAYQTIKQHQSDQRNILYTIDDIENFKTHDIYFNAAMKEMVVTGFMPNYLRMYWAKKIMEWQPSMKEAYELIKKLNNKYFLDGRDPNTYASIAWCFGKHDRAWNQRAVFGKIRYMNQQGLKRKFDMDAYVDDVNKIKKSE